MLIRLWHRIRAWFIVQRLADHIASLEDMRHDVEVRAAQVERLRREYHRANRLAKGRT